MSVQKTESIGAVVGTAKKVTSAIKSLRESTSGSNTDAITFGSLPTVQGTFGPSYTVTAADLPTVTGSSATYMAMVIVSGKVTNKGTGFVPSVHFAAKRNGVQVYSTYVITSTANIGWTQQIYVEAALNDVIKIDLWLDTADMAGTLDYSAFGAYAYKYPVNLKKFLKDLKFSNEQFHTPTKLPSGVTSWVNANTGTCTTQYWLKSDGTYMANFRAVNGPFPFMQSDVVGNVQTVWPRVTNAYSDNVTAAAATTRGFDPIIFSNTVTWREFSI